MTSIKNINELDKCVYTFIKYVKDNYNHVSAIDIYLDTDNNTVKEFKIRGTGGYNNPLPCDMSLIWLLLEADIGKSVGTEDNIMVLYFTDKYEELCRYIDTLESLVFGKSQHAGIVSLIEHIQNNNINVQSIRYMSSIINEIEGLIEYAIFYENDKVSVHVSNISLLHTMMYRNLISPIHPENEYVFTNRFVNLYNFYLDKK